MAARRFPLYYRPRPYQREAHSLMRQKKVSVFVWPRQAGKDVTGSIEQVEARLRYPKTTGTYISLNTPMIRDILWDKTMMDPSTGQFIHHLRDNVPADLVSWKDTFMEGRFTNGSRLKLQGYFQSGRDTNGVGSSFQDYTITELALFNREDPIPRLMPILDNAYEEKRLMILSTPRGKRRNPLWQLMQSLRGTDGYGEVILTIDDLNEMMRRDGLPPVRTQEQLEEAREAYKKRFGNDRMFEQEYYCSFEEMDAAAVYGEAYMQMEREQRIHDFNLNTAYPLYVVFDIGSSGQHSDATSWIAFQWYNNRLFIYDCGEGHGRALPEYVDELHTKAWFPHLRTIILPWDGEHHEKAINATPADMVREKFHSVAVLAKSNKVWKLSGRANMDEITDIQQTRMTLYNTIVNKSSCEWLLECLENYKYEFNNKLQQWSERPLHDKYSHMMDALRYAVQATQELDWLGGGLMYDSGSRVTSTDYADTGWAEAWK